MARKKQPIETTTAPEIVNPAPAAVVEEPATDIADDTTDESVDEDAEESTAEEITESSEAQHPWDAEPTEKPAWQGEATDEESALRNWTNAGGVNNGASTGTTDGGAKPNYGGTSTFDNPFAEGGALNPKALQQALTAQVTGTKMCFVHAIESKKVGERGYQCVIRWRQEDTGSTAGTSTFWLLSMQGEVQTQDIQQCERVLKKLGVPLNQPQRWPECKGKKFPHPVDFTYSKDGQWLRGTPLVPKDA